MNALTVRPGISFISFGAGDAQRSRQHDVGATTIVAIGIVPPVCRGIDSARSATGLAVDRNNLRAQSRQNAAHPAQKSGLELVRIDQPQDASAGIMRKKSIA